MSHERRIAVAVRLDELVPHHQEVLTGVLEYARQRPDWRCVVDEHPTYSAKRRGESSQRYDGVIARASPGLQRRLKKLGIPLVNVWYQHANPSTPGVYPDLAAIGRMAADHLIDRGFRTLAFVGTSKFKRDTELGTAFAAAALKRNRSCVLNINDNVDFGTRREWLALQRHMKQLLETLPQSCGILAAVPSMARLVMTKCLERDPLAAQSVAVVCLDHVKSIVDLPPRIPSVDCNYVQVGRAAAELLDELMSGSTPAEAVKLIPPKGIIFQESAEYFAADDELVAASLRHISSHLRRPLSLDAIARAVAASPRSLQRRFEVVMGCSVTDAVRRLRIDRAKRLLVLGQLSIEQIARETGFSSGESFTHFFHREVGVSPSAYRREGRS